jgi:NO-binding membrane sensor protein with MHYT domain
MTISYDFWLLASSCVLAVAGCFAACVLVGQLHTGRGLAWAWMTIAAPVLGLTLWAMQFTALMAVRLPMGFSFDLPLTLFSIEPAVVATAVVWWLGRNGRLQGARLLGAVLALAAGATATRYFGLAAMRIIPGIQYDAIIFVAAIAASAAIAYFALHYAGRWISHASLPRKLGIATIIGAAMCAAQYLGMGAARVEPNAFSNALAASFDRNWLGYAVTCGTLTMLVALTAGALRYARSGSVAQVMRPGEMAG